MRTYADCKAILDVDSCEFCSHITLLDIDHWACADFEASWDVYNTVYVRILHKCSDFAAILNVDIYGF